MTSGYLPGVIRFASSISIAIASRYLKESSSEKPYDISYEECSMLGRVPVLSQCRERTREDRANQKLGILSCIVHHHGDPVCIADVQRDKRLKCGTHL